MKAWILKVPHLWWAVVVGVFFGSVALISIEGPKKGYGKAIVTGLLTAPLLALVAGGLLPKDTSLEMAALIGGVVALGGSAVIVSVARFAPGMVTAGLTGVARSFLLISETERLRLRDDGTPLAPDPEAEELLHKLDGDDDDRSP